jgi:epoxide hydrolase 4
VGCPAGRLYGESWQYQNIEGAGHWFMLEQPEQTNKLLLNWLKKHS